MAITNYPDEGDPFDEDRTPPSSAVAAPPRRASAPAGRVPPHSLQAEESLLGAMLLSRDAISAAAEIIDASHFYKPAHAHIYEAISTILGRGEPVDPVTVVDELRRRDLLDAVGGPQVLLSLQAGTPATSNASRYAKIVEEHALLRKLIGVAGDIAELGYEMPDDVSAAIDHAESLVFGVAQHRVTDSTTLLYELLDGALERLEALYSRGDAITGVPTGFTDLDELTAGLQPSALIVVGARPGMGKTSFALGCALHGALRAQRPVLFFSLEMSRVELSQRLLCGEARVDSTKVRNGKLGDEDWRRIISATGRLADAKLWIDDNPNVNVNEMRAKARRLKSKEGDLGLVVVDYVQLMTGRSNAESRQVEVSEISRGLKILARELECPVMALAQLNRGLEQRADKRPLLSDLRESGCLTADTRVLRADTGSEETLGSLLERGATDIPVWSVDDSGRMVVATMTHVFPSGTKDTFRLRLASGRTVDASANHPFLTVSGWARLDELEPGSRIGVPRHSPARQLVGAAAKGSSRKHAPDPTPQLAGSDLLWDPVVEIEPLGPQPVFDATVLDTHNFIANGIVVHNSLEQDADVVAFIYRDELYNTESPDVGTAEIIVAKHRSGPTDKVRLAFLSHYTLFANMAKGV